ncbi:MFS transporter [Microcella daejeonensis]|uniref:MFS transporter n=1 Tax=Microcella daejeonensis TaxID=2994971 RepID=A0A9E8MJ26_9MICO|nr:MFS transporter [Microcella daejeonensis]WAB80484.1 MFS transporter [Microcella daejeonensis]
MSTGAAAAEPRGLGRTFGNVFTANLVSSLGDGIARTASPLLAARLTDDPVLIAGLGALAMLPWLFFALPSGILVDRMDRRRALALAAGVRTVLAIGLLALVATDTLTIAWLYLLIFVYGACETLYDGAIRAVVPSIVPKTKLARANSRIEGAELVVQNFASAPLTSLLFAFAVLVPLGMLAVAFGLAVVLAVLLPQAASGRQFRTAREGAPAEPVVPFRQQFLDGWRFIVANRTLRTLWAFTIVTGLLYAASSATLVLFVLDELAVPEAGFGAFLLAGAAGGVIGSVVAARLSARFGLGATMAAMNLLAGVCTLLIGVWPEVGPVFVLFAIESGAITIWNILMMSLRQAVIPGRLLGRVHGTWRTLLWGTMPFGSLLGGGLALFGLPVPWIVGGIAMTLLGLVFYRFLMSLPDPETIDNGDEPPAATGAIPHQNPPSEPPGRPAVE